MRLPTFLRGDRYLKDFRSYVLITLCIGLIVSPVGLVIQAYVLLEPRLQRSEDFKLIANDGLQTDSFGISTAIDEDLAVIGNSGRDVGQNIAQGVADVYQGSNGNWSRRTRLIADNISVNDQFGFSVSIDEDKIIVGAPHFVGSNPTQRFGAAYVFEPPWSNPIKLSAQNGTSLNGFGTSVAISGNIAVVGSPSEGIGGNTEQGTAYIYTRNNGNWTLQTQLMAGDGAPGDQFGARVSVSGQSVIIGAARNAANGAFRKGAAYVYVLNGSIWTLQQKLTASDGMMSDVFGTNVSIDNNTVVVGAVNANELKGAAYVFTRSADVWTERAKLIAEDGAPSSSFASSISVRGKRIIIGAPRADNGRGYAYVFLKNGNIWFQQAKLLASDGGTNQLFGAVSLSGSTALVGASDANGTQLRQGATYGFENIPDGKENSSFDFDGDSKSDISIFRPETGVWWYLRSSDSAARAFQFGTGTDKLAPADYTGDGKADVAFYRPSSGEWYILRSEDSAFYAFSFGAPGDIPVPADYDGDGRADAAVFRPSTNTWYVLRSSGGVTFQQFGTEGDVPVVADYDGDGKADVAIFRPAGGEWWILYSGGGGAAFQFGSATDKPVVADYTGDGKADAAFWRPSTGEWFISKSEPSGGYYAFPFGANGDIPTPGDYDGDGKIDAAVFRPSNGVWYVLGSTAGVQFTQFGAATDKPVPAAYIP